MYYRQKVPPTKEDLVKLRKFYIVDNERLNRELYYHMDLQAKGVKYKPRSKDDTYHGRKAIHCLMGMDFNNRRISKLTSKIDG